MQVPESPTEDPMDLDPVYDSTLYERVPEQFRHYTLERVCYDTSERNHFAQFVSDNFASKDLDCWLAIDRFRRVKSNETRDQMAKDIKIKFLNKNYFLGPNSPAGRVAQERVSHPIIKHKYGMIQYSK